MSPRMDLYAAEPEGYRAMMALEKYLQSTRLTTVHQDLIKVRASQVNGCAFCIHMHTRDAIHHGESEKRLFLLDAWQETDLFTQEEKAVLALTEAVTLVSQTHVPDEVYRNAEALFDPAYLGQLLMAIITINAWNRIGITMRMQPA